MEEMLGISSIEKTLYLSYVFSSTKLEKRAEQVLPGSKGTGDREEKWPKQCTHI
jgi:hypothetical protein